MEIPSLRRRCSSDSVNSPEFEFWNNNLEPLNTPLHSADELFSHGFLLPLHFLSTPHTEPDTPHFEPGSSEPSALITSDASSSGNSVLGASKRWREIFKKKMMGNNDLEEIKHEKVDKRREKDRKTSHGPGSAELNINIWPFSRSRSAGNNSNRSSKPALSNRKVSSAPCSRSNSSGESKSSRRSWSGSPSRAGVHLGRASPVWHLKRTGPGNRASAGGGGRKGKVLNVNVPLCVGYQEGLSCRSDGDRAVVGGGRVKSGGRNGNLFGLRGLFSKKSNSIAVLTA